MNAPRAGSRTALFWALTLFAGLALATLSGEAALRAYDAWKGVTPPATHNLPEVLAIPSGYSNFDLEPSVSVVYDAHRPRRITINRWGFRGDDYDPVKPSGHLRVFCLGGSSTFDPFVSDAETWCHLLGVKLSLRLGRPVEAVNAGRYGYTTSEILGLVLSRILRHAPDVLVLYSTYNDSLTEISPYHGRDDGPRLYGGRFVSWLTKRSALFAFLDFRLRHQWPTARFYGRILRSDLATKPAPPEHREFMADPVRRVGYQVAVYRRNVRALVRLARDNQVHAVLATQVVDPAQRPPALSAINETLRAVAAEDAVPLVDLDAEASGARGYGLLESYVHLSRTGCERVSEVLAARIEAVLRQ